MDLPEDIRQYYNIDNLWVISIDPPNGEPRSFIAEKFIRSWDNSKEICLYAGNSQGGPAVEYGRDYRDSVIEGRYNYYQTDQRFSTQFAYSQFDEDGCL